MKLYSNLQFVLTYYLTLGIKMIMTNATSFLVSNYGDYSHTSING